MGPLVEEAAVELKMDPAELRRRNVVTRRKFPYPTASGMTYDCGDFEGVLADAVRASDWAGYPARREQARSVGDVLLRRTRLGLTAARPLLASDAPERVAALVAAELGGDAEALARAFRFEAEQEGILVAP